MKKTIKELIDSCSESVLTMRELNSQRGGEDPPHVDTYCSTDETTDMNGDGVYDDCHNEHDDSAPPLLPLPVASR
jgi:hypothetical protein